MHEIASVLLVSVLVVGLLWAIAKITDHTLTFIIRKMRK